MPNLPSEQLPEPPAMVAWNGYAAKIHDLDDMLLAARDHEIVVYEREAPFAFADHVARLAIKAAPVILDQDRRSIKYNGTISFNGDLSRKLSDKVFSETSGYGLRPANGRDGPFKIEKIGTKSAVTYTHAYGDKLLVYQPRNGHDKFLVTNFFDRELDGQTFQPADETSLEPRSAFECFMAGYIRTVVYAANVKEQNPYSQSIDGTFSISNNWTSRAVEIKQAQQADEPKARLVDVGGLEAEREILSQVAMSYQHPEVMEKWGARRPQGILLHGPPGTGKTMLVHALANEIEAEVWDIQSTDIYEKWIGKSEQHIKDIFFRASKHKGKLVIVFDELDAIVSIDTTPGGGSSNARNSVAGIFKQEMAALYAKNPNVLIAATTNNLDAIDPSLRRSGRFDYILSIALPDEAGRAQIIAGVIQAGINKADKHEFRMFADDIHVPAIAQQLEGFSGADITEVFRRLKLDKAMAEARSHQDQPPISQADIQQAIRAFRQN